MSSSTRKFLPNDIVAYIQDDGTVQIGKVKRVSAAGVFVWFHLGDTATLTPPEKLRAITNSYVIDKFASK